MILSDSHECKNSSGGFSEKSFISHFKAHEGVAGNPFFIVPACLYLGFICNI